MGALGTAKAQNAIITKLDDDILEVRLIAAEQLDRVCYGMEIEPRYCDVIVRRYYNLVGWAKAPKKHRDRWRLEE